MLLKHNTESALNSLVKSCLVHQEHKGLHEIAIPLSRAGSLSGPGDPTDP